MGQKREFSRRSAVALAIGGAHASASGSSALVPLLLGAIPAPPGSGSEETQ